MQHNSLADQPTLEYRLGRFPFVNTWLTEYHDSCCCPPSHASQERSMFKMQRVVSTGCMFRCTTESISQDRHGGACLEPWDIPGTSKHSCNFQPCLQPQHMGSRGGRVRNLRLFWATWDPFLNKQINIKIKWSTTTHTQRQHLIKQTIALEQKIYLDQICWSNQIIRFRSWFNNLWLTLGGRTWAIPS